MPVKVLLADDDERILQLLAITLEGDSRLTVLLARDGQEALDVARRERPDLVFLDVLIPKINGYQVCRALREDPATTHTRVVMLTALAQEVDRAMAVQAGADDYLTKPFSVATLFDKVEEVLGSLSQRGPALLQSPSAAGGSQPATLPAKTPGLRVASLARDWPRRPRC